jgi:hypothetical protein
MERELGGRLEVLHHKVHGVTRKEVGTSVESRSDDILASRPMLMVMVRWWFKGW